MHPNHLQVFYFVYREGGFHAAARAMAVGQPTVSTHVATLEEQIGERLFERRPFRPTPLADEIFRETRSFFEMIERLRLRQRSPVRLRLRVAATEFILREYLLPVLAEFEQQYPGVDVVVQAGGRREVEEGLRAGRIDLAVAAVDGRPDDLEWQPLLRAPAVLLAGSGEAARSAEAFWQPGATLPRLIVPPSEEGVCRVFDRGLRARGVYWPVGAMATSTALVPWMVRSGRGVGLCVGAHALSRPVKLRVLPLEGFEPVVIGALWRGERLPAREALLQLIEREAYRVSARDGLAVVVPPAAVPERPPNGTALKPPPVPVARPVGGRRLGGSAPTNGIGAEPIRQSVGAARR